MKTSKKQIKDTVQKHEIIKLSCVCYEIIRLLKRWGKS